MPRQRNYHGSTPLEFGEDFPQRFKRFKQESGLSWSEMARRLGTYRNTVWRWANGKSRLTINTAGRCWNWLTAWGWPAC